MKYILKRKKDNKIMSISDGFIEYDKNIHDLIEENISETDFQAINEGGDIKFENEKLIVNKKINLEEKIKNSKNIEELKKIIIDNLC